MQASIRSIPRRNWTVLTRVVVAVLILLAIAYLAVGAVAASIVTVPKRQFATANTPDRSVLALEDVRMTSRGDNIPIAAWYLPRQASDRVVILVHGKDASRTVEFAGAFVELAQALQRGGLNVLMIDLRGHGQSGEGRYSFGLNERRDVEGAVDWLLARGYGPGRIGVLGVSLGASAAIGATADEPRIGALVTDSSFAEFCPILQSQWAGSTGLPDVFAPSTVLMIRLLYGYDLCASRPVAEVGRIAPRPILLIHSTDDALIPVSNFYALKAAAPSAETWLVSGPEHARIYNADPKAYRDRVIDFFARHIPPTP
jgi:uncharacterized protein